MVIAVAGIVFLLFLFVLAGLLLASIVVEDWNTRLISFKTLIELVVVRVSLAGLIILVDSSAVDIGGEFSSSLALFCEQLSFLSLGLSCAMAVVVVALINGLSMVTKKLVWTLKGNNGSRDGERTASIEPLGAGDIKLVGVCCLYLSPLQLPVFVLLMTVAALVLAGYFFILHKETAFPFAPAIILGCLVAFIL